MTPRHLIVPLHRYRTFIAVAAFGAFSILSAWRGAAASAAEPPRTQSVPLLAPARATLELHAHLFMKEGMTWAFRGGFFDDELTASSWTQRFSQTANPDAMDRSEIGLVVATFYAHPLFTISLRESVRRQVKLAERWVAEHPNWVIARDAGQARAALDQGKRAVVLALEGADGMLETDEDLREFVDEDGIRIVNLLHLTDDQYGGVAFMPGIKAMASPWAWLTQSFHPEHDSAGTRINARGLSDRGRAMAEKLMQHHVWLDLAHASDRAQDDLQPMFEKAHLPLLFTHTILRKYMGAERGISAAQLARVRESGGIAGLMPADDMLGDTATDPAHCAKDCARPCHGGLPALAQQYSEMTAALSPAQVAFGSDWNGGVHHLPPYCALGTGLDGQGLWNIGQQGAIWDSLEKLGLPVPSPRRQMIDRFLDAWARINPPAMRDASPPKGPHA